MKYKILRLIESKNTMKESTNSDIKRMRQDLYARERQVLKDLGDPKWEDLVGLKNRLPEDQFNAFMKEEAKINTIEMIHSILTYTDPDYWTVDNVMSNKYMKKYIEELGEDVVSDIVNQEVEEYKNNAIVDKDTYTDSEGVTYNSVRFKNESAMTENSRLKQLYDKLKEIEYDIHTMEKASFEFEGPKREHNRYFNNIEKLKAKKEKIKSQIEGIKKKTLSENLKEDNNYNEYVSVRDLGITNNVRDRERYDDEQFKKSGAGMITDNNPNSLKNKHNVAVRAQNAVYELEDYYNTVENNFTGNASSTDFETKKVLFDINNILNDFGFEATINKALGTNSFDACLNYIKIIIIQLNEIKNNDLNNKLTEDIDTGKDLENDTVNQVVDDMQDETTAEEEEESNSLDNQLADLREVLPDLDLNLYQVIDKEDTNKVFYFIGKVAEDSDDLLMLIDNNPSNDIDEPSNIDNKLPEDEDVDGEINDLEDDTEIQNQPLEDESNEERFDFIKVPLKYEDFITLNPRYGNDINPDHEAIMEYLMKCLVEENPERAEELSDDNLVSEEDNTKVPLDDKIQSQIDDKIEFYANN